MSINSSYIELNDFAADCPIFEVITIPEVITLVPVKAVFKALRGFPQFENVALV
jgi:hypothetical protein